LLVSIPFLPLSLFFLFSFIHSFQSSLSLLCVFFWVIPRRLNFICRRFGTLFHLHRPLWRWNRQSVPKRRHIKFRRRGITQKKTYNIQNTAKVWRQDFLSFFLSFCPSFFSFFASCRQFYICLRAAPVSSCVKFLMQQHWFLELLASHQNSSCGPDRPTVIKRPSRCDSWARRTIKPAIKSWIRGNRIPRGVDSNFFS